MRGAESKVEEFAMGIFEGRRCGRRIAPAVAPQMGRLLAQAVAEDVKASAEYDPENDVRVRWCRELIARVRRGEKCVAGADLETAVMAAQGLWEDVKSGKLAAAGAGGEE